MEEAMEYLSWMPWALWQVVYVLFWTWPFYYVSWLSLIVLAIGARTEYVKQGGGVQGLTRGIWFAVKNFPRTMNEILRWIVMQILLLAGFVSKTDIMSMLPNFIRRWLGHGPIETRTVYKDRIVERTKWRRPPIKWRVAKTGFFILIGVALTRAYDYGYLGPWSRTLTSWFYNLI